jgi:hypothetical protein
VLVGARGPNPPPRAPTPPSPLTPKKPRYARENPLSLTIPITSRDNQSRQRRCAPTLIGIAGIVIGFIQEC